MTTTSIASLTARDVMNPRVEALRPSEDVLAAVHWLLRRGYSGAPVVDDEGKLAGVLSEHDCVEVLLRQLADATPAPSVQTCMSRDVHSVQEGTPLLDVAQRFVKERSRRLLVLDAEGRLRGLITRRDLLRGLERGMLQSEPVSTYDILTRLWR